MNLYKVDIEYYNYLHYYEPKIPYIENEKQNRPFLGIVLNVNGKNFFAPLTSPKRKHLMMNDMQDFLKIDDGRLGGINLNNMLPIPKRYLYKIEINKIVNNKYKKMLYMQIDWVEKNKLRINNRARNLYYLIINKRAEEKVVNRCCNFKLLEDKCEEYMIRNNINEDEILYIF